MDTEHLLCKSLALFSCALQLRYRSSLVYLNEFHAKILCGYTPETRHTRCNMCKIENQLTFTRGKE